MSSETTEISQVEGDGERGGQSPDQVRREIEEQFNVQRAKMKDLFLQKEVDLQRMQTEKEQLESEVLGLRAEVQQLQILSGNQLSEIQNLQLLVSETVEVSSSGSEELRRLKARNNDLEQLVSQLRHHISQQEVSLAPATFVRSLARKLGGDTEVEQPSPRKNVEDGELMQSIIQPMDMEITALKNKLRETDAQLQEVLKAKANTPAVSNVGDSKSETESTAGTGTTSTQPTRQCDMCANYEEQLVAEQSSADAARERANKLDQALRLATEELEGVRSLHDETVRSWHGDRALSSSQLEQLQGLVRAAREELGLKAREAEASAARALECVTTLTVDRETLQKKLDTLERDNAVLMGQYTKKAAEMQNEVIDLPDNVAELQLHTLQLREQLIECAIGRELALEAETELRAQLLEHGALFHRREDELRLAREALRDAREQLDRLQTEREQMKELGDKLRQSSDMIEKLLEDKKRLQAEVYELRSRVSVLQQELDNSEMVQQDFVRLSQSLQVQLQRIREANTEVRWQHEEDVTQCPSCHTALPHTKKKVHCRHCGRIFCSSCVSHAVPCGPRRVPARVCSVCHTLLQPDTAPYFSTDPPTSPH